MNSIDLNCDIGEGFGNYSMTDDAEIMNWISSANIACGLHAGDPIVMYDTVALAKSKGVAIGAHPGLPDLQGFGRREMKITSLEVYQFTLYQLGAIYGFVKACDAVLHHVKAHGALYNMAARDKELAGAFVRAVYDFDPALKVYAIAGTEMQNAAEGLGLSFVGEVFVDRSFQDDGKLTPRTMDNAVVTDPEKIVQQIDSILSHRKVITLTGKSIPVSADTICVHGDHPHALQLVKMIHTKIRARAFNIQAP